MLINLFQVKFENQNRFVPPPEIDTSVDREKEGVKPNSTPTSPITLPPWVKQNKNYEPGVRKDSLCSNTASTIKSLSNEPIEVSRHVVETCKKIEVFSTDPIQCHIDIASDHSAMNHPRDPIQPKNTFKELKLHVMWISKRFIKFTRDTISLFNCGRSSFDDHVS